jgi:hypothetical protein
MNSCQFAPGAVLIAMICAACSGAFVATLFCLAVM